MKFYPYEKGGRKFFSHAEGGHNKFWGIFYTEAQIFSHTDGGGAQKVPTL